MNNLSKHSWWAVFIIFGTSVIATLAIVAAIDWATFPWNSNSFNDRFTDKIIASAKAFQIDVDSTKSCFGYGAQNGQRAKLCPRISNADNDVTRIFIDFTRKNNGSDTTINFLLAESSYNMFLGRITLIGSGADIQKQVYQLGYTIKKYEEEEGREDDSKSGFRWLQSIIEVLKDSTRMNTKFLGWVQNLIYLFSMIALTLMLVDVSFVRRNMKILKSMDFLNVTTKEDMEITSGDIIIIKEKINEGRQQFSFHPMFETPIVYDALEPSVDLLLTYQGIVNRGELLSSVETICHGVQERLERRFQILRYFVMTIPSLGFIGTIVGISNALGLTSRLTSDSPNYEKIFANEALGQSLNVAFDTTLVGLIASIFMSFFIDLLESWELNFTNTVKEKILNRLSYVLMVK